MLSKFLKYPTNKKGFVEWYLSNETYRKFYYNMGAPMPFDVTLRDGLQTLNSQEQQYFTTKKKKEVYDTLRLHYMPKYIEVGSIVSENVLPVMNDSKELFKIVNSDIKSKGDDIFGVNNFLLIPNIIKLRDSLSNTNCNHFSFVTSVSDSFQLKNTRMTIEETKQELQNMIYLLDDTFYKTDDYYVKLYISCVNECPIEGKINNNKVIAEILDYYNNTRVDNICLSDTCGTLTIDDFNYIVTNCNLSGIPYNRFSLHLHVKQHDECKIEELIHSAFDKNIINFDVSLFNSGGCSVTMDKNKLIPNLTYDLYYKSLVNYIVKNA